MAVWFLRSRKDRLLLTEDYFDTVLALTVPGDSINVSKDSGGHFAKYWGGGGGCEIFNMYAFGVGLRYANLSNIMLGISTSLFDILL